MAHDNDNPEIPKTPHPDLPDAAKRALAEAEERRRRCQTSPQAQSPKEIGGPKGPEPTRYGDWENKGIASDF